MFQPHAKHEWQRLLLDILFSGSDLLLPRIKSAKVYHYAEWRENKAHCKQQHGTSPLARQSIMVLLGCSRAQQVHLGKAASTTAKNLLFLSALVVITYYHSCIEREKKCLPVF